MKKETLSSLFEGKLFRIPEDHRKYSWEERELYDFTQDIDALIDEQIINQYTGTIVIFQPVDRPTENYGTKRLEVVDVIDGQQRLTTCSLYLSIILRELIKRGETDFEKEILIFLKNGSKSKLRPHDSISPLYFDLINTGIPQSEIKTVHQKRLLEGYNYLQNHISTQVRERNNKTNDYLKDLFDAIIRKMKFSFYSIEVESEIEKTFELIIRQWTDKLN